LTHRSVITKSTTPQATAEGRPGYLAMAVMRLWGGWSVGSHQGMMGATPAMSARVRSLRVTQPFTFGRELRHTKRSQARRPIARGTHPYNAVFWSNHTQARNSSRACCPTAL